MIFTLFQLTNQTKDIFHFKFPILKISRLLTIGDPVKTLSIRARLWSSSRLSWFLSQNFFFVELGSCSSLLKSRNSALKVSIQIWKEQSWRYNHSAPPPPPTTNNFKKPLEWWFSLYFSSQTKLKIFSISNFQFLKFQDSWQLEIL